MILRRQRRREYVTYIGVSVHRVTLDKKGKIGLYAGLLAASYSIGQIIGSPVWGYVSDSVGRRPVILAGIVV